jgi:very-short-patch-repair endonuclease
MLTRRCYGPSKKEYKVLEVLQASGLYPVHQFPVPETLFVADFCFVNKKIIVEVDGHPYHYTKKGRAHKRMRDKIIRSKGYTVIHLRQKELDKSMDSIVSRIKTYL